MFRASRILKASIKNNSMNVPLKEYVEIHTKTTAMQIDAIKGQFIFMNTVLVGCGGLILWTLDKESTRIDDRFKQVDKRFEQVDKRFEQVDADLKELKSDFKEIKEYILSSNTRK